jgi:hypothetical protein
MLTIAIFWTLADTVRHHTTQIQSFTKAQPWDKTSEIDCPVCKNFTDR